MNAAKFPIHRDLLNFDWKETPSSQYHNEQLATAGFMTDAHHLILVDGAGTGKTDLPTALGWPTFIRESGLVSLMLWI